MDDPGLEFLFEATGGLQPPILVGETPVGIRRVVPIEAGGRFTGPRLSGRMIGGYDWQHTRPDGVTVIDATYLLETDDGVAFQCRNRGLRHASADVSRRMMAGEAVDPADYYFRTAPEFSAPAGPYDWLNRSLFVCTGARFPTSVAVRFYRIT